MKCPQYAEINGKRYKINTSYKVAIKCNEVATDETIGATERAMAIIYLLFGNEGLDDFENHADLLRIGKNYLSCGKEMEDTGEEPDMDYNQDMDYIEASFMSDYNIDLTTTDMDWWKFNNLMNGLSNSELGNCCVLNKIRNIRNIKLSDIKDLKEREKVKKMQESIALKKKKNNKQFTEEQEENIRKFYELSGVDYRKE